MTATAAPPDTLSISCDECGAVLVLEPHLRTAECPYCASTSIVERATSGARDDPSFALGFAIPRERAEALCTKWVRTRGMFTRSEFKRALPGRARGLYLPAWLCGAAAHTEYACEIGEDYTETYVTRDSKGRTVTRTRTVTEWRPLAGRHATWLTDVLVSASKGVPNALLEKVEPFDLRALRRYTRALLAGFIAEEPSRSAEECRELMRTECVAAVGKQLPGFLPGDHQRNLVQRTALADETSALVLLPVWVFAVRHSEQEPPVQVLVNGQTGEVAGDAPRSWKKVVLFVGVVLAVIAAVVLAIALASGGLAFGLLRVSTAAHSPTRAERASGERVTDSAVSLAQIHPRANVSAALGLVRTTADPAQQLGEDAR